jgi:rod shape determining protein RodA
MNRQAQISKGVDWSLIWMYILLIAIGVVSIFIVQYREVDNVTNVILKGTREYGKQFRWIAICAALAIFILLTDSKLFTATANLVFGVGILLILITFVFHANVRGSRSFLGFGSVKLFQPAEFTKLFALLALAKFLSKPETNFTLQKNHLIAAAIILVPSILTILQNETGLALVYFALFLPMYREGFPIFYMTIAISAIVLVVATLLSPTLILSIIIIVIGVVSIFLLKKQIKRQRDLFVKIIFLTAFALAMQIYGVQFLFAKVFRPHQTERIYSSLGIDDPYKEKGIVVEDAKPKKKSGDKDSYNVKQSKIAIGSGGFWGKGFLNNTQTRYDFVPEQHTDFIFCSVAEGFGFVGSFILILIYLILLWRITVVAERQRSTFSRVYAYGVAAIIFFHVFVNIAMTLGLAPVIGIPLPFLSYGGTSLITFTVMLFILIKLDADRQMVLR